MALLAKLKSCSISTLPDRSQMKLKNPPQWSIKKQLHSPLTVWHWRLINCVSSGYPIPENVGKEVKEKPCSLCEWYRGTHCWHRGDNQSAGLSCFFTKPCFSLWTKLLLLPHIPCSSDTPSSHTTGSPRQYHNQVFNISSIKPVTL